MSVTHKTINSSLSQNANRKTSHRRCGSEEFLFVLTHLCLHFRSVLKGEPHIVLGVDCHEIQQPTSERCVAEQKIGNYYWKSNFIICDLDILRKFDRLDFDLPVLI